MVGLHPEDCYCDACFTYRVAAIEDAMRTREAIDAQWAALEQTQTQEGETHEC